MSPRKIQFFLILGVLLITLHFTVQFGIEFVRYLGLRDQAQAEIKQWEILSVKDRFAIKADYEFVAQNKTWQNSFTLKPPYFLNEVAALEALRELAKMHWDVWYQVKNPAISALEREFPKGLLYRALICYGVLIYFFYLSKRVVRV